jgi:transposase InsO family protein
VHNERKTVLVKRHFQSYEQLRAALDQELNEYNTHYYHSAIGYIPPRQFDKTCLDQEKNTPLKAV